MSIETFVGRYSALPIPSLLPLGRHTIRQGRATGWTDIAKIPVDAIIERWMAKGCEKGQSRRLQKLFADGHVVDAEMEQAAGVTVSDVRVAT